NRFHGEASFRLDSGDVRPHGRLRRGAFKWRPIKRNLPGAMKTLPWTGIAALWSMFPPSSSKPCMGLGGNGLVVHGVRQTGKRKIIKELPAANFAGDYFKFHIGICLPSTCTANDLKEMLGLVPIDFVPLGVHRCEDGRTKSVNIHQMVFLAVLALLAALVLSGTVVDAWQHLKNTELKDEQKGVGDKIS
ncbi:NRF domain-containing protein, partial [Caerostris extrusa]